MIQSIVFDLDDTLYPEREFVLSGYRAVARYLSENCGLGFEDTFNFMSESLEKTGRRSVFSNLIRRHRSLPIEVSDLVTVYRNHVPEIHLYPGYQPLLESLSRDYRLGVITDGLPQVQARKVGALGIERLFIKIIYSWEYGPELGKPHPHSFSMMMEAMGMPASSILFVGDNPDKDGLGARNAGMRYAEVRGADAVREESLDSGETTDIGAPEYGLTTLLHLPRILDAINRMERGHER